MSLYFPEMDTRNNVSIIYFCYYVSFFQKLTPSVSFDTDLVVSEVLSEHGPRVHSAGGKVPLR